MSIYDDHSPISADILEWLLGDEKVASKWKDLAVTLRLEPCIPPIDQNISVKRKKFDKQKLKEFMSVWRRAFPKTYTISTLIRALGQVGCTDMVNWLVLLHTGESRKKIEIASLIDASRSTTPLSYSPYSWHSAGGGSNEDRPESSRSFNSDDRESSPARPISSCSSSETLRRTMTTTTTTRTIERRVISGHRSAPKNFYSSSYHSPSHRSEQVRSQNEGYDSEGAFFGNSSSRPSSSSLKGSQGSLVTQVSNYSNPTQYNNSNTSGTRTPKVVSFKDTAEEYENHFSSSLHSIPESLEPLPKGISMEKYFDNLISMIKDAAEDLKV